MKVSAAIQILPNMQDTAETVRVVDEVIAYIQSTGLGYFVGPFETTIEGEDLDQLMEVIKECQKVAIRAGSRQVMSYVKLNYSPEGILSTDEKTKKYH